MATRRPGGLVAVAVALSATRAARRTKVRAMVQRNVSSEVSDAREGNTVDCSVEAFVHFRG